MPIQYIQLMQHIVGLVAAVLLMVLIGVFLRKRRSLAITLPRAEAVFLTLLALYPVFGYLLAYFVTKFIEGRYIMPALIGVAALIAIMMTPLLENQTIGRIVLALLFAAIAGTGVQHIRAEMKLAQGTMTSLMPTSETERNLARFQGRPVYVMNPGVFQVVGYYSPSADIRSRMTLIYTQDQKILHQYGDFVSITTANMRGYGFENVVSYESVSKQGTEQLFLVYRNPGDWTEQALEDSHAQTTHLGEIFDGELVSARFP